MGEKSLMQQLKLLPKIIALIIGLVVVRMVTKNAGFPDMFVTMYMGFVVACFVFFVLLDVPPMKELDLSKPFRANFHLLVTFVFCGVLYAGLGAAHPQFSPEYEIAKMNRPPRKELPTGPEAIEAGYAIFQDNKCTNCHKTNRGGSSDRGPALHQIQIGVMDPLWIKKQIIKPRIRQHPQFDSAKAKKAMPTYFGDDIVGMDMDLLLVFLGTQINDKAMPVVGRAGSQVKWKNFPAKVAYGQTVFEGEANEDVNCSVCHGKDATPVMQGAAEFKNAGWTSNRTGKPFSEYKDADLFESVMYGVEDTPMMAWSELGLTREQAWGAVSYIRATFQKDFDSDK